MADETDTASEVARVLIQHIRIGAPGHGDCSCGHVVPLGDSFAAHQAAMLAEAGLLRDYAVNVHESCNRELGNALAMAEHPQIATQEPAGGTQGGSGDSRVSGGLGERLRAAVVVECDGVRYYSEAAEVVSHEDGHVTVAPVDGTWAVHQR